MKLSSTSNSATVDGDIDVSTCQQIEKQGDGEEIHLTDSKKRELNDTTEVTDEDDDEYDASTPHGTEVTS